MILFVFFLSILFFFISCRSMIGDSKKRGHVKTIVEFLIVCFMRSILWFRYDIEVKGLDKLTPETLNKPGGILFLPNHPTVFVDATSVTFSLWPKFRLRPLIVEYMYYLPFVNGLMRFLNALPVPNFSTTSNSLKRKKIENVIQAIMQGLRNKENFLIFPAGKVKHTAYEAIEGASAVHKIIQETPEVNIVLVRVKGLWGSSFSRALTGKTPTIFGTIFQKMGSVFKNLIFFTPRRKVIIEFEPVPKDFPYNASRLGFNKYLEQWYNKPDGLVSQSTQYPGDSLVLVSYSRWKKELPEIWQAGLKRDEAIQIASVPQDVQKKVLTKISELTSREESSITPNMSLTADLGMDSLDLAELIAFLQDQFDISGVNSNDLTTVGKFMALASKQIAGEETVDEEETDVSKWNRPIKKTRAQLAEGNTIPEVFLNNCERMNKAIACADMRAGVVTYSQLKLRTIILANYIKKLPGEYVGILLPASVAASMTILACQLAGKIPVMINWTVGPRHLQAIKDLTHIKTVLTSWSFIDKLQNVDFTGIEEQMVMLEDVRAKIGLKDKLKSFLLSKNSPNSILKAFGSDKISRDTPAVILFTSGTESMPKGVPLSHYNILSNQRASLDALHLHSDDVLFGILPPFHSFGFTISSLAGLLAGIRVAFSPDPTDGKSLAKGFEKWGVTIICGAPTFIKGMLKVIKPEQLKTLRLCITGAEKMPPELDQTITNLGKPNMLFEGYGITECAPVLTFNRTEKPRKGVGEAIPGVDIAIVNVNTHAPVPKGETGLILARGPNVFSKYLNPGLATPFIQLNGHQWYNTGDLGHLDSEGNLHISGRLKRFIKIGGEMVSLASIEDALLQEALKKRLGYGDEGPILAITAKEQPGEKTKINLFTKFDITVDDVNKSLKDAGFSNLVKVSSVTKLPEIPIMGTGKVNYRLLEEKA